MIRDERSVTRKAKAMTRQEVMMKAVEGRITWIQAAEILVLPRQPQVVTTVAPAP